jgi:hypothetical protein
MAFLWWNSSVREIPEVIGSIGELKVVIAGELGKHGFADVRRSDLEVAGGKAGCWVSIAHFEIAPLRYWEVVMASGDTADAKAVNDEAVAVLQNLKFL